MASRQNFLKLILNLYADNVDLYIKFYQDGFNNA